MQAGLNICTHTENLKTDLWNHLLLSSWLVNDIRQRLQLALGLCCSLFFCLMLMQGTLGWLGSGALIREGKMLMRRERFLSQFAISEVTGRHGTTDMAECLAWFPCYSLKPLWGVASISHILWVGSSLDYRNGLIKLVYSVWAELGWHCKVWIKMLGVTEQILDSSIFLKENVTWNCCPGLLFLNCHLA